MSSSMILNLSAKLGLDGGKEIRKEIAGLANNIRKSFGDAYAAATDSGLTKKSLAKWEKEATRIEFILSGTRKESDRKRFMENEKEFKKEHTRVLQLTSRRQKAAVDLKNGMQSDFEALTDGFATGLGSAIGNAVSLNFAGIGNQLKGLGKKAKAYGGKKAGEEGSAKGIGKWAPKIIKLLGTIAMKIGMTAGIIGLLIAGMAKVVNHGRQVNKTLMDGGASAGDFATNTNSLHESLENVKKAFPVKRNLAWMQTTKEAMEILGAWNSVGHTFKDMGDGLKDQTVATKNYQKAVETATTYAKLFNTTGSEMATNMGSYMEDLGHSLTGITEKFSQVYKVASNSSFGTKRFFGMVLQATSGMAMYNVRINETAALLLQMNKLLGANEGQRQAAEAAKGGGRRDDDTETRYKETKLRGTKKTNELMKVQAANESYDFVDMAKKRKKEKPAEFEALEKAFGDVDIKDMANMSGEKLSKALSKLSQEQFDDLQLDVKHVDPAMARKLGDIRTASLGYKGTEGGATAASQVAKGGTKILMDLTKGMKLLGGKTIGQSSDADILATIKREKLSGAKGEEMLNNKRIDRNARSMIRKAEKQQAAMAKLDTTGKKAAAAKFNKTVGKKEGMVMDDLGRMFRGQADKEGEITSQGRTQVDTFEKFFQSMGQGMGEGGGKGKEQAKQVSEDIRLAQEIAHNTEDVTKALDIMKDGVMERIYTGIMDIYYWIMGDDKKVQKEALQKIEVESLSTGKDIDKTKRELSDAERAFKKDPKNAEKETAFLELGSKLEELVLKKEGLRKQYDVVSNASEKEIAAAREKADKRSWTDKKAEQATRASNAVGGYVAPGAMEMMDLRKEMRDQRAMEKLADPEGYKARQSNVTAKEQRAAKKERDNSIWGQIDLGLKGMGKSSKSGDEKRGVQFQADMENRREEAAEKRKVSDQDHIERIILDKQPGKIANAVEKALNKKDVDRLIGKLMNAGASGREARKMATSLTEGSTLDADEMAFLKENKGNMGTFSGMDRVEDFIWRPGQGVTRISAKDVIMGGKPGGPMASAGGGGGSRGGVINHFYNDSKGFLANQAKMKRAMSGHA